MKNIIGLAGQINPAGIYSYIDKLQVWLRQPLARRNLAWLRGQCGMLQVRNKPASFDWTYVQRLQLNQPTHEAIQFLSTVADLHLNYVEVALDWTFEDEDDRNAAIALVVRHHVKRWHRDQGIRFVKWVTRYSGPRSAPNVLATYHDKHCRITGELLCVHLEWRIRGVGAARRAGITCLADLLKLDHRRFWQERLLMRSPDPRKLGRMYHSHIAGRGRRRGEWITRIGKSFSYDHHLRTGSTIIHCLESSQAVVDTYRKKFNVGSCMRNVDVEHLLPHSSSMIYADNLILDCPTH
jgi:hypothetical protein